MARRRGKSMPGAYATGSGIYPIIPYRVRLEKNDDVSEADFEALTSGVLDFDLQFEDNEVMDLFMIEWEHQITKALGTADAANNFILGSWLMENPELTAVDVLVETGDEYSNAGNISDEFVTNSALVDYFESVSYDAQGDSATAAAHALTSQLSEYKNLTFPQPYVVARNVLIASKCSFDTTTNVTSYRINCTVWGRRRKANDAEFKNIIYRQRF